MSIIQDFEKFLLTEIALQYDGPDEIQGVRDAVADDVRDYRDNHLKPNDSLNTGTIEGKLDCLREFYKKLEEKKAIAGNPVQKPLSEFRENHNTEADRPYIPFARMQYFLQWLDHPFSRAAWLLALKNGVRNGEEINIDLRCLNIAHPVFDEIIEQHGVVLDPRIRDKPDTILIYGSFNEKTEMPNGDTPGFSGDGEIRKVGNKRKQEDGSIIPIDSELKTALIEWLLARHPTHHKDVHPLFTLGGSNMVRRIHQESFREKLWGRYSFPDSIRNFSAEETLDECPDCGGAVIEENLKSGEKTGRRFECMACGETHWRSIHWDHGLQTEQKVTHHQGRHYFSSAHSPKNSGLHDGIIPDSIRKKEIRGDDNKQNEDTEDAVYIEGQYQDFESDVREPYLDGIYKFGVYDDVIPAVGEGWEQQ
jgi:predicted RNA-binding Zn-ribbon protein involved in translation (DUF1610 family)